MARRRWLSPPVRSRVFDRTLAVLLALGAVAGVVLSHPRPGMVTAIWTSTLLIAVCLAMAWRRTRPAACIALTMVSDIVVHAAFKPVTLESLQFLFALYAGGRYLSARTAWLVTGPAIATEIAAAWFWPSKDIVAGMIIGALVVALGQYLRLRGEFAARRRAEAAEAAVRSERRRIARELHDVVAHHISVMSVLVGAARTTMSIDPEKAAEALATTEKTAREALAEMRQLLAVLRADDGEEPDVTGARAAHVPELVEAVGRAGVPVTLKVEGRPRDLPAAVDLAVYRIVQEALTNVRKHAPGASASVKISYGGESVEVEIIDDGATPGKPMLGVPESGYGLGGMAERAALCNGRLQAGARPEGGFAVRAWLPIPAVLSETDFD